uniref:Ubiquitin-like protein ATG12 n=1 Tax=Craspedostauros australis TaxID=1486917 RepID=A0A7R9WT85_9STRA|mmetsp:Transcript_19731/g.54872  ORF Transcript_19731/g.54872 Transcript_19731/m.54872 type:complete len:106 (+) Transcript_19731:379-696(+)
MDTMNSAGSGSIAAQSPKVKVHFVPVGSAPILKKSKIQMNPDLRFFAVHAFLKKILELPDHQPLFLYCSSSFSPGPEELLADLRTNFANARSQLIVHYSLQEAWG